MLFKKKSKKDKLAFGIIPAFCLYQLSMERYRSAAEIIKEELVINENSKILDVGCGEGSMKYFFDDLNAEWTGIEVWKERAEMCRKLGYSEVHEIDLNNSKFTFEDESFDVVFASHVVEHLAHLDLAIQEMARVLKPGGILLIATPTKPPPFPALINLYYSSKSNDLGATQNAFSVRSLKNRMQKILGKNFNLIDCRGFRILSARKRLNLEDHYWFYRANTWIGEHFSSITPEVNLIYKKG